MKLSDKFRHYILAQASTEGYFVILDCDNIYVASYRFEKDAKEACDLWNAALVQREREWTTDRNPNGIWIVAFFSGLNIGTFRDTLPRGSADPTTALLEMNAWWEENVEGKEQP